MDSVVFCGL